MNEFTIKPEHLKLLQRAYIRWDSVEFGAPAVDSKRPYGNGDVINDMIAILFGDLPEDVSARLDVVMGDYLIKLHHELETVLQICLVTQKFEVGRYIKKEEYDTRSWTKESK